MPLRLHENILVFYKALPTYNPQWWYDKPYKKRQYPDWNCYGKVKLDGVESRFSDGRRYPVDVLQFSNQIGSAAECGKRVHPTEKPSALMEYLIRTYTNEGELVLDNCIGGGATAVAAVRANRHFIGFDTEKDFCDIARQRVEKELQLKDNVRRLEKHIGDD